MNRYALLTFLLPCLSINGCTSAPPEERAAESPEDANRHRLSEQLERDLDRGPRRTEPEIAADDAADAQEHTLEIYDVSDLVSPCPSLINPPMRHDPIKPEEIEAAVKRATGGGAAWQEPASYEFHRGQMIVNQTRAAHREVMETLRGFRDSRR